MAYDINVGSGGYAGWKLLERTLPRQSAQFLQNFSIKEPRDYFLKKISDVKTAEDFVQDYRLMTVALRSFGLDDDMKNKSFIRKVLESDANDERSFVNRLADKRYLKLNQAMSFGAAGSGGTAVDRDKILTNYDARSIERNIGARHSEIELALNARRELPVIASSSVSGDAKWYQILASRPLRKVFEGAFGLGSSFAALPIERQLSDIKDKTERLIGSNDASQLGSQEAIEALTKKFLLRSQMSLAAATSPYSIALTILTGR